jgi:hypothetical protein
MTNPSPSVPAVPTAQQYRKKPIVISAVQWFKNGDHPEDAATEMFDYPTVSGGTTQRPQVIREGAIVRYFRRPDVDGESLCSECGVRFHDHGWIDTLEDGHRVCPGDWIITGIKGERYPCKPHIFAATYESASPTSAPAEREEVQRKDWIITQLRTALENWGRCHHWCQSRHAASAAAHRLPCNCGYIAALETGQEIGAGSPPAALTGEGNG